MLEILVSILFLVKTTDSETYMHSEAGKLVLELIAGIDVWSSAVFFNILTPAARRK